MAATAAQIIQVRRMVAEATSTTYPDTTIATYIEAYPMVDERGEPPYTWDTTTTPPTRDENDDWIDTYDLNAAAADIWEEKAAALAANFDFSADGASYSRSQAYTHATGMARFYRAKRASKTFTARPEPLPDIELLNSDRVN